ncbi:hypothetical protein N431DRAFT_467138 [Stipitochalara longipes BDJ]|nr:hypothetical protein N431DRAFT_467138 [Stipitochalara longipes BDJ]
MKFFAPIFALFVASVVALPHGVDRRQNDADSTILERNVDSSEIAAYGGSCKREVAGCGWIEG